jgi:hypothetical protein
MKHTAAKRAARYERLVERVFQRAARLGLDVSGARRRPLRGLYQTLNRDYFENRLPAYRVVRHSFEAPRRTTRFYAGEVVPVARLHPDLCALNMGLCDSATRTIYIWDQLDPDGERRVLLHEMCHVAARRGGHGPAFLAQLQRLAERGETWAATQHQRYAEIWQRVGAEVGEEEERP